MAGTRPFHRTTALLVGVALIAIGAVLAALAVFGGSDPSPDRPPTTPSPSAPTSEPAPDPTPPDGDSTPQPSSPPGADGGSTGGGLFGGTD
ncbi:hypothetical protein GTY75_09040 [Streptomyces sp. SID8381]|uniref:hypothetical protein n=1 Tax=unclassified Streptomyces TaxID=2593676 RepID=UPI00037E4295|nr:MULTISPECIES: hypothetical protein [unclassified Streptomyces]MYX26812.1 hypothetical protein [Streptomyces sp. SID8381]